MSPRLRITRCIAATLLVAATPLLLATTVLHFDANDLVGRADRIAHVTCYDVHSYVDPQGCIVTRYSFVVHETLKGQPDNVLTFTQLGGEYNGYRLMVPGLSEHRVGDESVLFLGPTSPKSGLTMPVGLDQGLYRVKARSDVDETPVVRRTLQGLHRFRGSKRVGADLPEETDVATFKNAVRSKVLELSKKED